ncbi:MAG: L,D-transpeptidase family protein, partial [Desulfobacteraceae bacterium]|nr:L,D-transpeptidase family protein [Desulfobacteraceae bacterium]
PREYLELKKDGTFYLHEIPLDTHGKWEVKGSEIRLHLPIGLTMTGKIEGSTIIDPGGETWIKEDKEKEKSIGQAQKKEKRKLSRKEKRLLGKYVAELDDGSQISLELKRNGTALASSPALPWEVLWEPEGNHPYFPTLTLWFYDLKGNSMGLFYHASDGKESIKIPGDFNFFRVDFWHRRIPSGDEILGKKEGAELIKLDKVRSFGETKCLGKVEIWNRYVNKRNQEILKLKRIPNFTPPGWRRLIGCDGSAVFYSTSDWKISDNKITLIGGGETKVELEIKGNTFVDKKQGITFVKQTSPFPLSTSLPTPSMPESTTQPPHSATLGLEEKEKLVQQIDVRVKLYSDKNVFPPPPISLTLRMTVPHLVKKVETIYFSALDYQFLSLKSLRYAKYFLEKGDIPKANKYIEKADRYYKLATSLQRDSLAVLQSTISAAEWMVVYKASRTALGFTATGLGIEASIIFDIGTLYTDYLLDTSTMSVEEAKKNLIAKAISNVLLRFTGTTEFVGDAVKHGWGSSRAFPALQKIMGSSEFKDAVLKEFMRLGGDVGDYVAKETIEEVLARIIKGGIEEEPEKKEVEAEESLPLPTREEFPETLPKVSLEPSPEGAKLIAEAEQDLTAQPKRVITARDKLNKALTMPLSKEQQSFVKKRLSEVANKWLFSKEVFAGDVLSTKYQVKPGESISSIARTNKVPYEILIEVNRIKHPRSVQAGKEIKLIHGPFHAVLYRSTFTMDLYLQKTFVRSFRVGLGKPGNETPTGLWRIKSGGKLISPAWTDPHTGRIYEAEDPDYPLGSRWIGLEGIEGEANGRTGFGIHGTKDPGQIGTSSTIGCICLHDEDAILAHNLLVPIWSKVKIVE